MSEKTFRIDAKIRNNLLIKAREELGYASAAEAARALNIRYAELVAYESLKFSPWKASSGEWRISALQIASAYKKLPEDLWPDVVREVKKTSVSLQVEIPPAGMLEPPQSPEKLMLEAENASDIDSALSSLTFKERRVIERRYGIVGDEPMTLDEVGDLLGCGRENVRRIEFGALAKMRSHMTRKERENESLWSCVHCGTTRATSSRSPFPVQGMWFCDIDCYTAAVAAAKVRDESVWTCLYCGKSSSGLVKAPYSPDGLGTTCDHACFSGALARNLISLPEKVARDFRARPFWSPVGSEAQYNALASIERDDDRFIYCPKTVHASTLKTLVAKGLVELSPPRRAPYYYGTREKHFNDTVRLTAVGREALRAIRCQQKE